MRIETCSAHVIATWTAGIDFRLAGLACVAERNDTVWTVTVADVSYARSESLAEAIVEAAGGTVAAEVAREAADTHLVQERHRR